MAHGIAKADDEQRATERSWTRAFRHSRTIATSLRWAERRQFYPHLQAMPVFAGCVRRQIWRIARWGDVIEVQRGEVLAREDRSNHWFFVVLAGSVRVSHRNKRVATLHRGGHFGEVAVIGFRPQPATVTATESTVLFVLSRRHFLSLAATDQTIQRALFPDVTSDGYRTFVRALQEEGKPEWERLKIPVVPGTGVPRARPPTGRRITMGEAVEALTRRDIGPGELGVDAYPMPTAAVPSRGAAISIAVCVLLAFWIAAFTYHPPFAVLTPSKPIDVVGDITISGAKVERPTGRYLLTAVNVSRPTLGATLLAWVNGRTVFSIRRPDPQLDPQIEVLADREAFRNSHKQAIELAERSLGIDPRGLTIVIRDRGIGGPSGGLVYALAIIDMLDPDDLAADRTIAATGELLPDGKVSTVGLVRMKVDVARDGGADIFFVPLRQSLDSPPRGIAIVGVTSLADAVRELKKAS